MNDIFNNENLLIYLSIGLIILSIVLLIGVILIDGVLKKKKVDRYKNKGHTDKDKSNDLLDQITRRNVRKDFRIYLNEAEAVIKIIGEKGALYDDKDDKILEKKVILKDVSIGGMRIETNLNLDVSNEVLIEADIYLESRDFRIMGKVVRKETHYKENVFKYGIQFLQMDEGVKKNLFYILNKILKKNIIN